MDDWGRFFSSCTSSVVENRESCVLDVGWESDVQVQLGIEIVGPQLLHT